VITWVLLTRGDRPVELEAALDSIRRQTMPSEIVVVVNGADDELAPMGGIHTIALPANIGVPGGRNRGVEATSTEVVAFLDDDAVLLTDDANERIEHAFADDPACGALSFRIEDEDGHTQRRHVPRIGSRGSLTPGPAATFLGGASAVRRSAYDLAGGYWSELFYAHEELDLSWRLHDAGFRVLYLPDIVVLHPSTPIGRHPDGWTLTGRNRVLVARRNLPWPVAFVHVSVWLALGWLRAPDATCRRAYLSGWRAGWSVPAQRRPVGWRTVWRLARVGRPPIL
jgi:GT2 family glycosyltransferase